MADEITLDTLKIAAEIVNKGSRAKNMVRIPPRLYQAQPQAYTPLFVSVGPFHHIGPYSAKGQDGKNRFKDLNILASETKKQAYMLNFLSSKSPTFSSSGTSTVYELVDGQTKLETFQRHVRGKLDEISSLYREEIEISHEPLANIIILERNPHVRDVVERLRDSDLVSDSIHLLDFIYRYHALERSASIEHNNVPTKIHASRAVHLRSATKLSASGVTMESAQVSSSHSVLKLAFSKGVLRIPPLLISDYTETLFINLLAHEHLSPNYRDYFTSYVFLMAQLIESEGDLQLLEKKGMIHSELGSRGDVSKLFSNIAKQFVLKDFFYSELCNEIEAYADSTWRRHIQVLKERYFSNPWATLSVFAATILLLLTFMQTFYTALSYYQGGPPK